MTPCEHSRLLFLLDALRAAPHKARRRLLELAGTGSPRYVQAIERLRGVSEQPGPMVLAETIKIRQEIL